MLKANPRMQINPTSSCWRIIILTFLIVASCYARNRMVRRKRQLYVRQTSVQEPVGPEPMSLLSNCSYSFGLKPIVDAYSKPPSTSFLNISSSSISPGVQPTVVAVNVGFGTTGTHTVYDADNVRFGRGCHYHLCKYGDLVAQAETLKRCVDKTSLATDCRTANWMLKMRSALLKFATNGETHLCDTPIPYMVMELRSLLPNVLVQHSVRNPLEWAVKRVSEGHQDTICATHMQSPNPFHILECMQGSEFLHENLMKVFSGSGKPSFVGIGYEDAVAYLKAVGATGTATARAKKLSDWRRQHPQGEQRLRALAEAYISYNRWIVQHVRSDKYQLVCVWDEPELINV